MRAHFLFKSLIIFIAIAAPLFLRAADRTTISLNGSWQIENSKEADVIPTAWKHKVPAPGLAHSVEPPFPQVDQFDRRVLTQNRVGQGKLPRSAIVFNAGVSWQERNWFWYRRTFEVPETRSVAVLRINKAQFGARVWLNGLKIGDHLPCFTAAIFDVSKAVRRGSNQLIVRVGAHPGVLPPYASGGTDFEKIRWTPGIYDNVSLALCEYTEWMRDNWNHPSVAIWDANNETWDPAFGEKMIPAFRGLDLSHRPWENSYNPRKARTILSRIIHTNIRRWQMAVRRLT